MIDSHKKFQVEPQLRTRLIEAIPFACGLLTRSKRYEAITDAASLHDSNLLALCFLETKLYDHSAWASFVTTEQKTLLDTAEENWNEKWLRKLHLFNVLVRDATSSSEHMPISETTPEMLSFFRTLVESQQRSLSTILVAYASQDAAAAFRLAEICDLDLAADYPDVIIRNCDQPPFFALIRDQALSDIGRIHRWAELLCEAALHSRIVATTMMEIPADSQLERPVRQTRKTLRWFKGRAIPRTLYTQLLTIAAGSASHYSATPSVQILKALPAPGGKVLAPSRVWVASCLVVLLAGSMSARFWMRWIFGIDLTTHLTNPNNELFQLMIAQIPLIIVFFAFTMFAGDRIRLLNGYLAIIGLRRFSDRETSFSTPLLFPWILARILFSRRDLTYFLGKRYRPLVIKLIELTN